jgi:type 1 fimbriae regulatory protein FimB/type 1 fimbriae regulatory protein FimE
MRKSHLALVAPSTVFGPVANGTEPVADEIDLVPSSIEPVPRQEPMEPMEPRVPPRKRRNAELRAREYLTTSEVERLIAAAGDNRHGHRDAAMILIAFRHGLRSAELVALRWDQVDFDRGYLHVARRKGGSAATHPLSGRELRVLRRLKREQAPASPFVFTSERGAPFATGGFRTLVGRLGEAAGFEFRVHPHMLRHACGYKLANDGVDTRSLQSYLGHRNIQHTVRYTELSPTRFKDFWRD